MHIYVYYLAHGIFAYRLLLLLLSSLLCAMVVRAKIAVTEYVIARYIRKTLPYLCIYVCARMYMYICTLTHYIQSHVRCYHRNPYQPLHQKVSHVQMLT